MDFFAEPVVLQRTALDVRCRRPLHLDARSNTRVRHEFEPSIDGDAVDAFLPGSIRTPSCQARLRRLRVRATYPRDTLLIDLD